MEIKFKQVKISKINLEYYQELLVERPKSESNYEITYTQTISIPVESIIVRHANLMKELPYEFSSNNGVTEIKIFLTNEDYNNEMETIELTVIVGLRYIMKPFGQLKRLSGFFQVNELIVLNNSLFSISQSPAKIERLNDYDRFVLHPVLLEDKQGKRNQNMALTLEIGEKQEYQISRLYRVAIRADLNSLTVKMRIPINSIYQNVNNEVFPDNYTTDTDRDENRYMVWQYENVAKGSKIDFLVNSKITRSNSIFTKGNYGNVQNYKNKKHYCEPGSLWDYNRIRKVTSNQHQDIYEIITGLVIYVNQKIQYLETKGRQQASETLKKQTGDCTEFSDLLIALLRQSGIPARLAYGHVIDTDSYELKGHAWVEFQLPNGNWLPVEPTWGRLGGIDSTFILEGYDSGISDNPSDLSVNLSYSTYANVKNAIETEHQIKLTGLGKS